MPDTSLSRATRNASSNSARQRRNVRTSGTFSRWPDALIVAFRRMRAPPEARAVADELIRHLFGYDEHYTRGGVPYSVRTLADALGVSVREAGAGLRWLLRRGVVVARRDRSVRGRFYCYHVAAPTGWAYPAPVVAPELGAGDLLVVAAPGFAAPVVAFPKGRRVAGLSAPLVDKSELSDPRDCDGSRENCAGASDETPARSPASPRITDRGRVPLPVRIPDRGSLYGYTDRLWVQLERGRRLELPRVCAQLLASRLEGWAQALEGAALSSEARDLPASLVVDVHAAIDVHAPGVFTLNTIRQAIGRAVLEARRLEAEAAALEARRLEQLAGEERERAEYAIAWLADLRRRAAAAGDVAGAALEAAGRVVAQLEAGDRRELPIAEALLEQLGEEIGAAEALRDAAAAASVTPEALEALEAAAPTSTPVDAGEAAAVAGALEAQAVALEAAAAVVRAALPAPTTRGTPRQRWRAGAARMIGDRLAARLEQLAGEARRQASPAPVTLEQLADARAVLAQALEQLAGVAGGLEEIRRLQEETGGILREDRAVPDVTPGRRGVPVARLGADRPLWGAGAGGLRTEARAEAMPGEARGVHAGEARGALDDEGDGAAVVGERLENASVPVDPPEDRAVGDAGGLEPGADGGDGAQLRVAAGERHADALAGAGRVGFATADRDDQPVGGPLEVANLEAGQLGTPERAGVAQEDQRAIALPGGADA